MQQRIASLTTAVGHERRRSSAALAVTTLTTRYCGPLRTTAPKLTVKAYDVELLPVGESGVLARFLYFTNDSNSGPQVAHTGTSILLALQQRAAGTLHCTLSRTS